MGRKGVFIIIGAVGVIGLVVFLFTGNLTTQKAVIQMTAYPQATVFINGQQAGTTPYENDEIKAGEIKLKMVPENQTISSTWGKTLSLTPGTETVINWDFNEKEELESGQILYLEKTSLKDQAGLVVVCYTTNCEVSMDGQLYGNSPLNVENIEEGGHGLSIVAPNHKSKEVSVRLVKGYRLVAEIKLAKTDYQVPVPVETETPKPDDGEENVQKVVIKETPTGWLRVRNGPGTGSQELGKVNPEEKFVLLGEESGWYKIQYQEDREGWISGQYAEVVKAD